MESKLFLFVFLFTFYLLLFTFLFMFYFSFSRSVLCLIYSFYSFFISFSITILLSFILILSIWTTFNIVYSLAIIVSKDANFDTSEHKIFFFFHFLIVFSTHTICFKTWEYWSVNVAFCFCCLFCSLQYFLCSVCLSFQIMYVFHFFLYYIWRSNGSMTVCLERFWYLQPAAYLVKGSSLHVAFCCLNYCHWILWCWHYNEVWVVLLANILPCWMFCCCFS